MFILHFFVRWNSTQLMIARFKKLKKVVIKLTNNPDEIDGIKEENVSKLETWMLSTTD